jgi:hypothetical protein
MQSRARGGGGSTSSSALAPRSFCFCTIPSRTRWDAWLRSALRTSRSPLPSDDLPASSSTRPAIALRRCAGVRSRSELSEPERSCVCTSLCSSASFWAFVLHRTPVRADTQGHKLVLTALPSRRRPFRRASFGPRRLLGERPWKTLRVSARASGPEYVEGSDHEGCPARAIVPSGSAT